jgi:hypothetical protein
MDIDLNTTGSSSNLADLYNTVAAESTKQPSVAPYLQPILDRTRMTRVATNIVITQTNLAELRNHKTNKTFPSSISSLKAPEAMHGAHELQTAWNTSHITYQNLLLDNLITFKESKLTEFTNLANITGMITMDFLKAMKFEISKQTAEHPDRTEQYRGEEQAMILGDSMPNLDQKRHRLCQQRN